MKLSLRARIIATMVIAAVLANLVIFLTIDRAISGQKAVDWSIPPAELARCEADPARWQQAVMNLATAWAYDADGRAANPAAPPLEPELLQQVQAQGVGVLMTAGEERIDALRVATAGPCAIIRLKIRPPIELFSRFGIGLMVGSGLALVLVVGLAITVVLQPLLHRIRRIQLAAEGVGGPAFEPAHDDVADALGAISGVLDRSHTRILTNEATLHARQRALERHLAEIAHDLRTPLASLLLAVQELAPGLQEASRRAAVRRALDDAEYVNALVDNLHQGTRLREGLETGDGLVELSALVERLGARFHALGGHQEIEVATALPEGPVWVRGAPALAERAIANLVHNAVRHGRPRGHVALMLEQVGAQFELIVLDDGPGLREQELADLHAATFLTDAPRRRSGGLGVAITNEICRRQGWQIHYEAEPQGGLRVTVRGETVSGP